MLFRAFILSLIVLGLAGCTEEREVRDGRVPEFVIPLAKQYVGTYNITLGERTTRATLDLVDNKLILATHGDLLRDDCNSQVGELVRVTYEALGPENNLRRAVFRFSPGNCKDVVIGRELEFDIEAGKGITAAIMQRSELAHRCDYWHPPSGLPLEKSSREKNPPSYGCRQEPIPSYLKGSVVRI